jgi:hypothetical protein
MVQAAAEAIPVAGSPLKAAIGSLLQIIQITDVGCFSYFMELHSSHRTTDKESKQGSSRRPVLTSSSTVRLLIAATGAAGRARSSAESGLNKVSFHAQLKPCL